MNERDQDKISFSFIEMIKYLFYNKCGDGMKKIYIILSYSGSIPSKIIKVFTHYKYSHVSLSLKNSVDVMYSFGRKKVNNPLDGGFIIEKKAGEFYKKFNKTKCIILELDINKEQYKKLLKVIKTYEKDIDIYRYDIMGLVLRVFNLKIKRKNYSVCTDFVRTILEESGIYKFEKKFVKPIDFMNIPNKKIIYQGNLLNY